MYENKYKNPTNTKIGPLWDFIQLLADLDKEIELFAMGGTAMVLGNIKEATKDIDFLTTSDYETVKSLFKLAGLEEKSSSKLCNIWYLEGTRLDIFYDEFIMGITLPDDWKDLSEKIDKVGKVKLYILNWFDIIITKIARSEQRDIEDIMKIMSKAKIDLAKLKKRYYGLAEVSLINSYDIKFKHLEKQLQKRR
ncbi:nucleotidyltransferase [Candidatus Woesearchaeota archaeon]|nr:nucleotidyltransferase [Candidatus Woesearchaeota archaeon]